MLLCDAVQAGQRNTHPPPGTQAPIASYHVENFRYAQLQSHRKREEGTSRRSLDYDSEKEYLVMAAMKPSKLHWLVAAAYNRDQKSNLK